MQLAHAPRSDLAELPSLVVRRYAGFVVVRDDLLPGGTKVRALAPLLASWPEQEFVFGGPAQGYAQLALAHAAAIAGKRATFFLAARHELHPLSKQAAAAGAKLVQVPAGRLPVVQRRAKDYAAEAGARFLPLGFDVPEFRAAMLDAVLPLARSLDPPQVWCVAGSGCLSRVLQYAWPRAKHYAVRIGFEPQVGAAELLRAPESFAETAELPPPFPSCPNYDAKAWRFLCELARPGALFWNVGA